MKQHLIFDLDGTLIDSAASILYCFALAFSTAKVPLIAPLSNDVIGPPLMETLKRLSGSEDVEVLKSLATAFKQHYDTTGYLQSMIYDGIPEILYRLKKQGYQLFIATNKRFYPTEKILAHFGWQTFFTGVYALDYYQPALNSKTDMIGRIVKDHQLLREQCVYIGDRMEDGQSADANQIDFILVSWGYIGDASLHQSHWGVCDQVSELPKVLENF